MTLSSIFLNFRDFDVSLSVLPLNMKNLISLYFITIYEVIDIFTSVSYVTEIQTISEKIYRTMLNKITFGASNTL